MRVPDEPPPQEDFEVLAGLAAAGLAVAGLVTVGGAVRDRLRAMSRAVGTSDVERLLREGDEHCRAGRHAEAVRVLNLVLVREPRNAAAACGLAWVLHQHASSRGELDIARGLADRAVDAAAHPVARATCLVTRARTHMRGADWSHAVVDLRAALELVHHAIDAPPGRDAVLLLATAHVALRQFDVARRYLTAAVGADPGDLDALLMLSRLCFDVGDLDEALLHYGTVAQLIAVPPGGGGADLRFLLADVLNMMGCIHFATGDAEEAERHQVAAMEVCPNHPYPSLNCAIAAGRRGDTARMRMLVDQSVAAAPPGDTHYTGAVINDATDLEDGDILLDALLQHGRITPGEHHRHRVVWSQRRRRMRSAGPVHFHARSIQAHVTGDHVNIGDTFNNNAQNIAIGVQGGSGGGSASVGPHPAAEPRDPYADLHALAAELALLRAQLAQRTDAGSQLDDIAELARAQDAAEREDRSGAARHLAGVGAWVVDVAKNVGVPVAALALQVALGLPT
jgi:tetratricopeptide (TPR) repeat protein